jgi:hypothetical protein
VRALREADLSGMERAAKLLILAWAVVALAAETWLLRGGWPSLPVIALSGFIGALALSAFDRRAVAPVLAFAYLVPVLVYLHLGRYTAQYSVVWMAVLAGAIAPGSVRTGWHVPRGWRGPLLCWALIVVISGSIVTVREVDFTPALINVTSVANTGGGGWPAFIVSWVLHVAVGLVLGILWFDWLLDFPAEHFRVAIATPLLVSALALAAVAIYQLAVDISFLNPTVFRSLNRASGTVLDANVCGTLAALWVGGCVLWAQPVRSPRPYFIAGGVLVFWLAVWASGSRTAFAAAALVTVFILRGSYLAGRRRTTRLALIQSAVGAMAVVGLLLLLNLADSSATGPLARFRATLPSLSVGGLQAFLAEQLWHRGRYGPASMAMIRQFPLFGVGVGSFQALLPEFALQAGGPLAPDNAQNWYRHQFAEVGLAGSLPWLAWVAGFGAFVLRRRATDPAIASIARGVLIAFGAISFVGMPGQDVAVSITFWTMAAWYVSLVGRPADAPLKPAAWTVIVAVLCIYSAGAVHAAQHDLRVPVRAMRGGWPYAYGFYPPHAEDAYRWTGRRAVAVVEAPAHWMELTFSVDYRAIARGGVDLQAPHASTRPVDVKIWRDGDLVIDKVLTTTAPVTAWVKVPDARKYVMIETWVSRVLKPREFGIADDRELGIQIRWDFSDAPRAGGGSIISKSTIIRPLLPTSPTRARERTNAVG